MTAVEDIKAKVDIVDLVGEHVPLKSSGRNFKANCPFHNERTPSFYVFPDRQAWHCFGACAAGGDILSFVMRRDGVDFGEALRVLALRAGVDLVPAGASRAKADRQSRLKELNRAAGMFFHHALLESPEAAGARAYLETRGLDAETIEDYRLGYSPETPQALQRHLVNQDFSQQELLAGGLIRRREDGSFFGFFRGRLMIPIQDARGDYLGFGARALDDATPKYINSPQSDLFDKSSVVYGLHRAVDAIKAEGVAVIVEGYMDVLTAHRCGFRNVVASMGTALTERQVGALKRLASTFVLAMDPDAAGDEATLRSLESSWRILDQPGRPQVQAAALTGPDTAPELVLEVMDLPRGKDPDALIRDDPDRWRELLASATPVIDYVFQAMSRRFDTGTPRGKERLTERLAPFIHNAPNVFEQNLRIKKLAELLKEEDNVVRLAVGGPRSAGQNRGVVRRRAPAGPAFLSRPARDPLEAYVMAMLLRYPELWDNAEGLREEHFESAAYQRIFRLLAQGGASEDLIATLEEDLEEELNALLHYTLPPANYREREDGVTQTIRRLEERWVKLHLEALQTQLAEAQFAEDSDSALELALAMEERRVQLLRIYGEA